MSRPLFRSLLAQTFRQGTVLDGRTIDQPTPLVDGSLIVVGATTLKFRSFAALTTTDTIAR